MERDKKGRRKACRKRKSKKASPASENSLEKSPENANSFGIDNDDDQFQIHIVQLLHYLVKQSISN